MPDDMTAGLLLNLARAASGQAAAVPPRRVMKSRRLMPTPSQAEAHIVNIQYDSTPAPRGMGDNSSWSRPAAASPPS
jgi:hypothetical protein